MKSLTVYTSIGTADRYPAGGWDESKVEDGILAIFKADGSKVTYAPGYWVKTETEVTA